MMTVMPALSVILVRDNSGQLPEQPWIGGLG